MSDAGKKKKKKSFIAFIILIKIIVVIMRFMRTSHYLCNALRVIIPERIEKSFFVRLLRTIDIQGLDFLVALFLPT